MYMSKQSIFFISSFIVLIVVYYLGILLLNEIAAVFLSILGLIYMIFFFKKYIQIYQGIRGASMNAKGKMVSKQETALSTYGLLFIIYVIYYSIVKAISDETGLSLVLATLLLYITYQVIYQRAGRTEEKRLIRKKRRYDQFTDAIAPNPEKCLSCFEIMEENDIFCAKCGFNNSIPK